MPDARPWGCHNRPPIAGRALRVQDGYLPCGTPLFVTIGTPWSDRCDHGNSQLDDPRCAGCRWQATDTAAS